MTEQAKQELMVMFPFYLEQTNRLFAELEKCPDWRMIRHHQILKQIGALNDWYTDKMKEWGLE